MGKERDVVGRLVEVLPPGFVVAGLVGDGRDVEDQVGRRCDGHIHLDGVADGLGGDDLACGDALFHHIHNAYARLVGDQVQFAGSGGDGGVARQGHTQRLGHHTHRVGGRH